MPWLNQKYDKHGRPTDPTVLPKTWLVSFAHSNGNPGMFTTYDKALNYAKLQLKDNDWLATIFQAVVSLEQDGVPLKVTWHSSRREDM